MLVGFVLRAISIDEPLVDWWSYRQSDVAMVARNFYLFRYDILHLRIDYGGAQPGYVGMEFPAVPFLAAALFSPLASKKQSAAQFRWQPFYCRCRRCFCWWRGQPTSGRRFLPSVCTV
jgi:hypothetical protein